MNDEYRIILDMGKPTEYLVNGIGELKRKLYEIYKITMRESHPHFEIMVLDELGQDISETQLIDEMIEEMLEEGI